MRKLIAVSLCYLVVGLTTSWAAISANTSWEIWPASGSDTNGGGFTIEVGTTVANADLAIDAADSTKITSAAHSFASDQFKYLKITAGTGFTFAVYKIINVSGTAALLDRSAGTLASTSGSYTLYSDAIDYSANQNKNAAACSNCGSSSVNLSTTDAVTNNTTTVTSATATFTAALKGNIIWLSGTGTTTGWYQVVTVTNGTTITVDRATGSTGGSGVTMNIGGALATFAGGAPVCSNSVFMKATGTLSMGATTFSTVCAATNATAPLMYVGYTSTRSDGGKVTVQPSAGALTLFTVSGQGYKFSNLLLDGTGANTIGTGFLLSGTANRVRNVKINNFTVNGISDTGGVNVIEDNEITGATSCTTGITLTATSAVLRNNVHGNACPGIQLTASGGGGTAILWNKVTANGAGNNCIKFEADAVILNNTLDSCNVGIIGNGNSSAKVIVIRNNLIANSTTGLQLWTAAGWSANISADGNCYYNNTTNRSNSDDEGISTIPNGFSPYRNTLDVILGSSPYVDDTHTSDNYAIKTTTNAYQHGTPGALPGISQTGNMSCGALTPAAASAGGSFGYAH